MEAEKLYSVNNPDQYHGLIKSSGKINASLIKSEKRGIIRILLSLLLQQNTQPVAWQHIIFTGRYHFKDQERQIDFNELIALLEKKLRKST